MRAIKIDVVNKSVYEVDMEKGIDSIYKQLECELFTLPCVLQNEDALYVDDEGLLKEPENQLGAFYIEDYPFQALFGHGLIQGTDLEGDSADAVSSLDSVRKRIIFLSDAQMRKELDRLRNLGPEIYAF